MLGKQVVVAEYHSYNGVYAGLWALFMLVRHDVRLDTDGVNIISLACRSGARETCRVTAGYHETECNWLR